MSSPFEFDDQSPADEEPVRRQTKSRGHEQRAGTGKRKPVILIGVGVLVLLGVIVGVLVYMSVQSHNREEERKKEESAKVRLAELRTAKQKLIQLSAEHSLVKSLFQNDPKALKEWNATHAKIDAGLKLVIEEEVKIVQEFPHLAGR
jgi:hypothetical protein